MMKPKHIKNGRHSKLSRHENYETMKLSECVGAEILNISYLNISIYISSLHRSSRSEKNVEIVSRNHRDDVRGKPKRKKFVIYLIFREKEDT